MMVDMMLCFYPLTTYLGNGGTVKNTMHKVKRGTVVESDYGKGVVIVVTREWIIHLDEDGNEVAVTHKDAWIPIEAVEIDVPPEDFELELL